MKNSDLESKQNLSFFLIFGQGFMGVTKANREVFNGDLEQKCRRVTKTMNSVFVGLMSTKIT